MTFTGTLIDDLMATVERVEQRAQATDPDCRTMVVEPLLAESTVESLLVEPWFASVQENAEYDSKLLGVA